MRNLKYLAIIIAFLVLMAFSWDSVELENRGFVISIGIDQYKEDDKSSDKEKQKDNRFTVTMALPNVQAITEKAPDKEEVKSIKKESGETLSEAMRLVDSKMSEQIYYGHAKAIVMGKDFLEDPELIREAIDALERNNEINRKIIVVATDKTADEILNAHSEGEPLVGLFIANFYNNNANTVSVTTKIDLETLISHLRLSGSAVIPQITITKDDGKEQIKLGGAAVIKDFKLHGFMSEEDMRGYLWLKGDAAGAQITTFYHDAHTPFLVSENRRKISFTEENGVLVCNLNVFAEGSVEGYKFLNGSLFDDQKIKELESSYEMLIQNDLVDTFDLFQKKYGIDGFDLKEYLRKWNYGLYQKYAGAWDETFQNMLLEPEVHVVITNTGAIK